MAQCTRRYRPRGEGEFIRLTKEYYTLKYNNFDTISDYLTYIKTLEERILATDVVLTPDKELILFLSISILDHLQYMTNLWDLTPNMTADKATSMLLEEERKGEKPKKQLQAIGLAASVVQRPPQCGTCGKNHRGVCWDERPDLAPEWLKERRGTKRKRPDLSAMAAVSVCRTF